MSDGSDRSLLSKASNEIGRAVIALIREEPFFGHLLSGINRKITNEVEGTRVVFRNGRPVLTVNPEFFVNELSIPGQRSAVIKHAVLYVLLDHRGRFNAEVMDQQIFAMASEVVISQLIGDRWPAPPGAISLDSFSFELAPDMTLEWYYEQLWEHRDEIPPELKPDPSDDDQPIDEDDQEFAIAQHELSKALRDARDRSGDDFALVDLQIQELVESMIDELEPSVDWRRVIRLFTTSSRRTRISNTLRRPSKRYGTYPGIKVKRLHRMAVIIDTSGSVNNSAFGEFFAEIHTIWRQGSEVTVIEADNAVRATWEYVGTAPTSAKGRGGTTFDPALQWVADAAPAFDAALYFTDGKAQAPKVRTRCEVLWVLPHDGDERTLSGRRIIKLSP